MCGLTQNNILDCALKFDDYLNKESKRLPEFFLFHQKKPDLTIHLNSSLNHENKKRFITDDSGKIKSV